MKELGWNSDYRGEDKVAMERFLDDVGWGSLFITVGVLWLVPAGLPQGTWMIAVGIILMALNVARHLLQLPVNGFTILAGTVALLAGIGAAFAIDLPIFPITLVVIGVCWLLDSVRENHRSPDREHGACC